MEKIRNLSIRKTIILYMVIALTAGLLSGDLISRSVNRIQEKVWMKYRDVDELARISSELEVDYLISLDRVQDQEMTKTDLWISQTCDFLSTWSVLILSVLYSTFAVLLFYRNKLKKPLEILIEGSGKIAQNELDFTIVYDRADEMGDLCRAFETMRGALYQNFRTLWHTLEEQKTLHAAISHDMRTPLAVMQGYHEMMQEFIPTGEIDQDKIMEIIEDSMIQINRLNTFCDMVKQISGLEEREVQMVGIPAAKLAKQIRSTGEILCKNNHLQWEMVSGFLPEFINADSNLVMEVVENLLSNATRFAKYKICLTLFIHEDTLTIRISDDGIGFTENVQNMSQAYVKGSETYAQDNKVFAQDNKVFAQDNKTFAQDNKTFAQDNKEFAQDNNNSENKHFGLGLYISRILCEKHGGHLQLGNQDNGGAYAVAEFQV